MFSVMIWTRANTTVILFTLLISQVAGQNTSFSFNSTTGINDVQGEPMFLASGDAKADVLGRYLALNTEIGHQPSEVVGGDCGRVVYKDKVKLVDKTSGAVASFHTSFTFSFASFDNNSQACGSGMLFMFSQNSDVSDSETELNGGSLCELNWKNTDLRLFAIEIDSHYDPLMADVSDSHISLDVGTATLSSHDLCPFPNTNKTCALFCGSHAMYTTWIDYDGQIQTLQVWFRNGSDVAKPTDPVISYPNLRLDTMLDEEMYVGFIGSTGGGREVHKIWAWEFATTGISPVTKKSKSGSANRLIGGLSAGALAGLLVAGIIVYFGWILRRKGKAQVLYDLPWLSFQGESRSYTFKELREMTNGFNASKKLSSGGFGDVYQGTLPSGELVAVKRIKDDEAQAGEASFLAEVKSLRQTRHRNLLHLLGWSYSADGMFLVYNYMCNGSLDKWLHPNGELNWNMRRAILAGVASGLEYLHEDGMKCVLHRDIKSSNVLLDADFSPHLGDFGLARLVDHRRTEKTTMVAGTLGYMAPEMMHTSRATKETDVYAFGVLALEIVTGWKPTRMQDGARLEMLVDSVWRAYETGRLESLVDPRLRHPRNNQEGNLEAGAAADNQGIHGGVELDLEVPGMLPESVLKMGLLCCLPDPNRRPSMRLVNRWFQSAFERVDMALPELPEVQPPYARLSVPLSLNILELSASAIML